MTSILALVVLVFMQITLANCYHKKASSLPKMAVEPQMDFQTHCSVPTMDPETDEPQFNCQEVITNGQLAECQHDLAQAFALDATKFGLDQAVPEFPLKGIVMHGIEGAMTLYSWVFSDNCPGADTAKACKAMFKQCDSAQYDIAYTYPNIMIGWFCQFWNWSGIKPIVDYLQGEKPGVKCEDHLGEFLGHYMKRHSTAVPTQMESSLYDAVYKWGGIAQWYHGLYMAVMATKIKGLSCARYRGLLNAGAINEISPACEAYQKVFCLNTGYTSCTETKPVWPVPTTTMQTKPTTTKLTTTTITYTYPKNPNKVRCSDEAVTECLEDMSKLFAILAVQRGAEMVGHVLGDSRLGIVPQEFVNTIVSIGAFQSFGNLINDMFVKNKDTKKAKMCVLLLGKCRPNLQYLYSEPPTDQTPGSPFVTEFCGYMQGEIKSKLAKRLMCLLQQDLQPATCAQALYKPILEFATSYIGGKFESGLVSWTQKMFVNLEKDKCPKPKEEDPNKVLKYEIKETLEGLLFSFIFVKTQMELYAIKNSKINLAEFYNEVNGRYNPDFDGVTLTTTETFPEWPTTTTITAPYEDFEDFPVNPPGGGEDMDPNKPDPVGKFGNEKTVYPLPAYTDIRSKAATMSPLFQGTMIQPTPPVWQHMTAPPIGRASNLSWNAMLPPTLPFWQYMSAAAAAASSSASNVSWHH